MISGVESAKLKVQRAAKHIEEFQACEARYLAAQPDAISRQPNGAPKIEFTELPPACLSIIAGEVIYQLRSALDHLAFDLIQLNPQKIALPSRWEERCQFPLLVHVPTKENPPVKLSPLPIEYFNDSLPGITKNAFTVIESLQPYHGGDGPKQLGWISASAKIDKHRYLHVIKPQAYHRGIYTTGRFITESITRVQDGAELIPSGLSRRIC